MSASGRSAGGGASTCLGMCASAASAATHQRTQHSRRQLQRQRFQSTSESTLNGGARAEVEYMPRHRVFRNVHLVWHAADIELAENCHAPRQLCTRPNPLAKRVFPWNHSNMHHPADQPSGNTAGRWARLARLPTPLYAPPRGNVGRAGYGGVAPGTGFFMCAPAASTQLGRKN